MKRLHVAAAEEREQLAAGVIVRQLGVQGAAHGRG